MEQTSHSRGERKFGCRRTFRAALGVAQIDDHVARAERDHEHRNHLGHPGDAPAPLRLGEAQDCADQRAGMRDTDEEHEVRDVDAPVDGAEHAGHSQAVGELPDPRGGRPRRHSAQSERQ